MTRSILLLTATLLAATAAAHAQDKPTETATPTRPQFVVLSPVFFATNSASLAAEARSALLRLAEILAANPAARITVAGHTDERGADVYNLALGRRRAEAVAALLREQGVAAGRLEVTSLGEQQPARAGHDESAWSQNRRVEFQVIGDTPLRLPQR